MSEFKEHHVVPDVIDTWPGEVVRVEYDSSHHVNLGNVLDVKSTQKLPKIFFNSDADQFYTVMVVDPDALSRETHEFRNFCHFVVVNVPGVSGDHVDVHKGHTVVPYMGPAPPPKTGLHRYVFLVYKQPARYDTHNLQSFGSDKGAESRKSFIPDAWLQDSFGKQTPQLQAANFFQAGEVHEK